MPKCFLKVSLAFPNACLNYCLLLGFIVKPRLQTLVDLPACQVEEHRDVFAHFQPCGVELPNKQGFLYISCETITREKRCP
jgi:hypothetical protein